MNNDSTIVTSYNRFHYSPQNTIEYDDNEIKVYHKFDDTDIINKINNTIIKTLETSGQYFELKKGDKMTVLRVIRK